VQGGPKQRRGDLQGGAAEQCFKRHRVTWAGVGQAR
jgi:hypothetical protein